MKSTDKFLIGIVAGIVLLVVVALAVTMMKPEDTYLEENTPESVVHDYLLALQKEDYAIAYQHLSSQIKGYPRTEGKFTADIKNYQWSFRNIRENTFSIDPKTVSVSGSTALVVVDATRFGGGDLFESSQYYWTFEVELRQAEGDWEITYADDFFVFCWSNPGGCK